MIPREKAFELINKVSYEMEQLPYSFCKSVAILIVDEIMLIAPEDQRGYWLSVKQEIDEV